MCKLVLALWLALCGTALAASIADSQVSCTTTASTVVGTSVGRISLCMFNGDSANPVYIGPTGVTTEYKIAPVTGLCIDARTSQANGFTAESVVKCKSTGGTVTLFIHEGLR